MWRYEVPADDAWHEVALTCEPAVAVVSPAGNVELVSGVEFWAERTEFPATVRRFRVFGTGHPIPDGAAWHATCERGAGGLVFHLYEEISPDGGV
jgi:hypothetical protein